jgi:hypothetical protein
VDASLGEPPDERVGQALRAAARETPAEDVPEDEQRQAEARARPSLEREHRVRGVAGEEGACALGREGALGERARGRERVQRGSRPECSRQTRECAR